MWKASLWRDFGVDTEDIQICASIGRIIVPGWRGAVKILSTVSTVDGVLLGSGESNKG
jgi:hypothetical protein